NGSGLKLASGLTDGTEYARTLGRHGHGEHQVRENKGYQRAARGWPAPGSVGRWSDGPGRGRRLLAGGRGAVAPQPLVLPGAAGDRRLDAANEERVGLQGPRLELGMELAADEVRVVGELDRLVQTHVRRQPREHQAV